MELSGSLDGIFTSVTALQHSFPFFTISALRITTWELSMFLYLSAWKMKKNPNSTIFPLQMKSGQRCTVTHHLAPTFHILPLSQMPDWHYRINIQHLLPLSQDSARDRGQQQFPRGSAHAFHKRLLDFQAKKALSKGPHKNNRLSQGARSLAA